MDNQVGYGVVDPVAALTWDVPDGPAKPPQQLSAPLNIPKAAPHRDMVPVWVAAGGLAGALLIGGAVFGTAMLMRRRGSSNEGGATKAMKAQRSFGLALSWPRVTAVFLVDIVILVIASHCPDSWQGDHRIAWWVGVGLAAMVTLLSLVTYHGLTVTSGIGRMAVGLVCRSGHHAGRGMHARARLPAPIRARQGRGT